MNIITYRTALAEDKRNVLIKESTAEYKTNTETLNSPQKIAELMTAFFDMENRAEEYLYMISLDTKSHPLGFFEVSHGTVNASIVSPRSVFIRALLSGATSIILCHNHPSGDCTPSKEDALLTKRIKEGGELLGVELLDHVIIGTAFLSMRKEGLL